MPSPCRGVLAGGNVGRDVGGVETNPGQEKDAVGLASRTWNTTENADESGSVIPGSGDQQRPRRLLLHKREIRKFAAQAFEKGLTLVPLKMYFKRGRAKLLLGVCRGRKLYDKREKMKRDTMKRDMARAVRRK